MSWTDERVEVLKKLWAEGHSASQIAKQLGGVTRNAVIGKVHRLGLSGRNTVAPRQAPAAPGPAKATRDAGRFSHVANAGCHHAGRAGPACRAHGDDRAAATTETGRWRRRHHPHLARFHVQMADR